MERVGKQSKRDHSSSRHSSGFRRNDLGEATRKQQISRRRDTLQLSDRHAEVIEAWSRSHSPSNQDASQNKVELKHGARW